MKKSDFPFRAGKESMRMGLESTPIQDWLTVSEEYEERTRLKKQLSEQLGQRVYAQVAYSSDEQIEFAELVKEFFSEIRPECCSLVLKLPAKNFGEYPLNDIAKYLEEDVCLLREMEGEYRLTAASVTATIFVKGYGRPIGLNSVVLCLTQFTGRCLSSRCNSHRTSRGCFGSRFRME